MKAGGKILTSSYPQGGRSTTHPLCLASVQMHVVASVCVPFYAGFGPALTLHCFNNEGVVKVWQWAPCWIPLHLIPPSLIPSLSLSVWLSLSSILRDPPLSSALRFAPMFPLMTGIIRLACFAQFSYTLLPGVWPAVPSRIQRASCHYSDQPQLKSK